MNNVFDNSNIIELITEINRVTNNYYYYEIGDIAPLVYMQGKCYYFAKALQKVVPNSELYLIKNPAHIILKVENNFYDARGLLINDGMYDSKASVPLEENKSYLSLIINKDEKQRLEELLDKIVKEACDNLLTKSKTK